MSYYPFGVLINDVKQFAGWIYRAILLETKYKIDKQIIYHVKIMGISGLKTLGYH